MSSQVALWAFGGGIVLCLMALAAVIIARSMDKPRSAGGAGHASEDASDGATQAMQLLLGGAVGGAVGGKVAAAIANAHGRKSASPDDAKAKGKQVKQAIVGAAVAIAAGGAVLGVVKRSNTGDIVPEIKELRAGALAGTMVNARNRDPIVLIVPGSGPTDRDGNSPAGLRTNAYKLLAEGLIEERISSVRIDKRGMFASREAGDPNAVTPAAYVADIHAWIDAIKAERGPKSGCIFLLGHSEGALMVSLAAEGRKDVCGVILVAGMGRKMADVIREQLKANPANAPLLTPALAALAELEAGRHVDTTGMHPALLQLFAPAVQDYLISVLNVDPVEAVNASGRKTLIVQGTTDLQIGVEDARRLNRARRTEMEIIRGMNHVLKEAPEDRAANLATYGDPDLPLHPKLVREIEDFIDGED